MAEGGVAGDEGPAVTSIQAPPIARIEPAKLLREAFGLVRTLECPADRLGDLGEADGVEPDVGVTLAVEHVDRSPFSSGDGVLDRGLKPATRIDDEVGFADGLDVPWGELDVVRLGARRGEVDDVGSVSCDLFGSPGERIEGGDDRFRVVAAATTTAGEGQDRRPRGGCARSAT